MNAAEWVGWAEWVPGLAVCMMRPMGAMLLLPLFNRATLGGTMIRNALILMIALPLLPVHSAWVGLAAADSAGDYIVLVLGEISIGLMIGFAAAIPFWALDMAGFLIDTMRGASMASILNPLMGQQSSIFGILFSQVFGVLFLVLGGFNQLITAIYESYVSVPPGEVFRLGPRFVDFLASEWQLMHALCLSFAMPAMVVMLLTDMALGLVNRSAQQLNVFFLAMPIKSVLTLLMLIVSGSYAYGALTPHATRFAEFARVLMGSLS